jgi:hypothetical protein
VDLEANNILFVVPIEDVVAVFRRTERKSKRSTDDEAGLREADDAE